MWFWCSFKCHQQMIRLSGVRKPVSSAKWTLLVFSWIEERTNKPFIGRSILGLEMRIKRKLGFNLISSNKFWCATMKSLIYKTEKIKNVLIEKFCLEASNSTLGRIETKNLSTDWKYRNRSESKLHLLCLIVKIKCKKHKISYSKTNKMF